jgi:hypothetical protein
MVLPAAHRLARRRELRMEDLAGERFNGPPRETSPGYRAMQPRPDVAVRPVRGLDPVRSI